MSVKKNIVKPRTALELGTRAAVILSKCKGRMIMVVAGIVGIACNNLSSGTYYSGGKLSAYPKDSIRLSRHSGITYINGCVATGIVFQLDKKGDTLSLEKYVCGKPEGIAYKKYDAVHFCYRRNFSKGKAEGTQYSWWDNGRLKQQATYKHDVFDSYVLEWCSNGLLTRFNHYRNGHEEGKQQLWYDNGQLRANYVVRNGRQYGLSGTMNCYNATEKQASLSTLKKSGS